MGSVMKKLHAFNIIFFIFILSIAANSQAPQSFNYQAVARDASGDAITNRPISVKFTLLRGPLPGTILYAEKHNTTTSAQAVFSLAVGTGVVLSGTFSSIDWSSGEIFLKVEIDPNGGESYVDMGTTQILSVPYALHAKTVENADDADADPKNELQDLSLDGNILSLTGDDTSVELSASQSLWTQSGDDIFYTKGKVGIGTKDPLGILHIDALAGTPEIRLQNNSTGRTILDGLRIGRNSRGGDFFIWNYENSAINFATDSDTRMTIEADGDILIDDTEVHRTRTGTADMLPYAYGKIYESGEIVFKTDNVSLAKRTATGTYKVFINNLGTNYIVVLTPNTLNDYRLTYQTGIRGYFTVYMRNSTGTLTNSKFTFIVYQP